MTMYASNAGKSGGEFYTPQEVSELLAEITTVCSGPHSLHDKLVFNVQRLMLGDLK